MTHCSLESVSNSLSRESGTFNTLHGALLDCPVEPPQAHARGWSWPVLGVVCAHSLCLAWLGLARLISTSLPKFLQLMEKINGSMRQSYGFVQRTKYYHGITMLEAVLE